MNRALIGFLFLFLFFAIFSFSSALAADSCIQCHKEKTPGIVKYWEQSAHQKAGVYCEACHGLDKEANHSYKVKVDAEKCGSCHTEAFSSHRLSKHAIGLRTGLGCTRNLPPTDEVLATCSICHEPGSSKPTVLTECPMFLAQSPEMQRIGCSKCHNVETGCDTCHTKHGTDLRIAASAETCGTCHMGPDHAQYEMWKTSRHGGLYLQGGLEQGPTCVTCHMPSGTHNVSIGIATGRPKGIAKKQRDKMVRICSACHTAAFSRRDLADADLIQSQSYALLLEAQGIVEALNREGLLAPAPKDRPEHPLFGHTFVIGPLMTYEDISSPEVKYFRMMLFHYMSAFKGAFHQNPDYTHWYGNAPLKMTLSELKSEAAMLRKVDLLKKRVDNLSGAVQDSGAALRKEDTVAAIKKSLRGLEEMRLKGDITQQEYLKLKRKLLDNAGL